MIKNPIIKIVIFNIKSLNRKECWYHGIISQLSCPCYIAKIANFRGEKSGSTDQRDTPILGYNSAS